jgi:hypothetical protein
MQIFTTTQKRLTREQQQYSPHTHLHPYDKSLTRNYYFILSTGQIQGVGETETWLEDGKEVFYVK